MDSGRKPRKRDRIISVFRRKQPSSEPTPQFTSVQTGESSAQSPSSGNTESGDRQRTRTRYLEAAKLLEEVVKGCGSRWGSFDFPELKGEPGDLSDTQFREKINTALDAHKNEVKDQAVWNKCRRVVECAFTAFSPFAKNFLTIAREAQSVLPLLSFLINRSQY
jgi:hypothetical protein